MFHDFSYGATLASSIRGAWRIEDVLREGAARLRLSLHAREPGPHNAEPGSARAAARPQPDPRHEYLGMFGIVEEFILPFVLDHARPALERRRLSGSARSQFRRRGSQAHPSVQALPRERSSDGFPVECEVIGPPEAIGAKVLAHDPLAVALLILHDRVDDAGRITSAASATTPTSTLCSRACSSITGSRRRSTPSSTR